MTDEWQWQTMEEAGILSLPSETRLEWREGKLYAQTSDKFMPKDDPSDMFYGLVTERLVCKDHKVADPLDRKKLSHIDLEHLGARKRCVNCHG